MVNSVLTINLLNVTIEQNYNGSQINTINLKQNNDYWSVNYYFCQNHIWKGQKIHN